MKVGNKGKANEANEANTANATYEVFPEALPPRALPVFGVGGFGIGLRDREDRVRLGRRQRRRSWRWGRGWGWYRGRRQRRRYNLSETTLPRGDWRQGCGRCNVLVQAGPCRVAGIRTVEPR